MNELSLQSPWSKRFMAWMHERFPLQNALLFFILYVTTASVARAGLPSSSLHVWDIMGCMLSWSFFLLLRIFDEHKDYERDCVNFPGRVLQRGLIRLVDLKVVGVVAVLVQSGMALYRDRGIGPTTESWLLMIFWASLMTKEFFVADWLNRHLTIYAFSHMLIMPLVVLWLAALAQPGHVGSMSLHVLMILALVSGFCFEITRKTKGPEEERPSVDSYSRIFGYRNAGLIVMVLVLVMLLLQVLLLGTLGKQSWMATLVIMMFGLQALVALIQYLRAPSQQARERNEKSVALAMLAGYAVVVAAMFF